MIETVLHKWLRVPHALHVGLDIGPRKPEVTLVFIHGLASSHLMWKPVIDKIDTANTRIIAVDLLGFGKSPKPIWQIYNAKVHAASLAVTLRHKRVRGNVVIVGHSLGSLVAVQYASAHPKRVAELILGSPPFYKPPKVIEKTASLMVMQPDDMYRKLYKYSRGKMELAKRLASFVKRAKLIDRTFVVDDETLPAIVSSLEMSIENQTSLQDAEKLKMPVHIIYGRLDPFVMKRNITELRKKTNMITIDFILAGHDVMGSRTYTKKLISMIEDVALRHVK